MSDAPDVKRVLEARSPAQGGLVLGVSVTGQLVALSLSNQDQTPLAVWTHAEAGEEHLDWFQLRLSSRDGEPRIIQMVDARGPSAPVLETLAPGQTARFQVDVPAWAGRPINGGAPLAPGTYRLTASYRYDAPGKWWTGRLEAGPVDYVTP